MEERTKVTEIGYFGPRTRGHQRAHLTSLTLMCSEKGGRWDKERVEMLRTSQGLKLEARPMMREDFWRAGRAPDPSKCRENLGRKEGLRGWKTN